MLLLENRNWSLVAKWITLGTSSLVYNGKRAFWVGFGPSTCLHYALERSLCPARLPISTVKMTRMVLLWQLWGWKPATNLQNHLVHYLMFIGIQAVLTITIWLVCLHLGHRFLENDICNLWRYHSFNKLNIIRKLIKHFNSGHTLCYAHEWNRIENNFTGEIGLFIGQSCSVLNFWRASYKIQKTHTMELQSWHVFSRQAVGEVSSIQNTFNFSPYLCLLYWKCS